MAVAVAEAVAVAVAVVEAAAVAVAVVEAVAVAVAVVEAVAVPKVCNCHQKWKRARFCNSKKCEKCITVIKNEGGHVFTIRKSAKSV